MEVRRTGDLYKELAAQAKEINQLKLDNEKLQRNLEIVIEGNGDVSAEVKVYGYKSLKQLAGFYGVSPGTMRRYHKDNRPRFISIMKECKFKLDKG